MTLATVVRYLCGDARAIRTVAGSSAALPFGICLVLLTAVARNYDQNYIRETPFWLFGSLIFSFVSGGFFFYVLYHLFDTRSLDDPGAPHAFEQWRTFMGLFWMTAPIAWLYAIPVERFFDPMGAAKANLTLLAIVSSWRVLLMGRVVSVIYQVPLLRGFAWVLIIAAIETIGLLFIGIAFGSRFSRGVLASMGGMRNAPHEDLLLAALGNIWAGAWVVLILTVLILWRFRYRGTTQPFPLARGMRAPWGALPVLAAAWLLIAWPAQQEQKRFYQHASFLRAGRYEEALEFLSRHQPGDFPPARRLEPNPYEWNVWRDLPPTISLLRTNTPPWVRETYLVSFTRTFGHPMPRYKSFTNLVSMYEAIAQLPEGREWTQTNESLVIASAQRAPAREYELPLMPRLLEALQKLGVSQSNLSVAFPIRK